MRGQSVLRGIFLICVVLSGCGPGGNYARVRLQIGAPPVQVFFPGFQKSEAVPGTLAPASVGAGMPVQLRWADSEIGSDASAAPHEPFAISRPCTLRDFHLLLTGDGMTRIYRRIAATVSDTDYAQFTSGNYSQFASNNLISADLLGLEVPQGPNREFYIGGVIYGGRNSANDTCADGKPAHLISGFARRAVLSAKTETVGIAAHFVETEAQAYSAAQENVLALPDLKRTGFVNVEVRWDGVFGAACSPGELLIRDVTPLDDDTPDYSVNTLDDDTSPDSKGNESNLLLGGHDEASGDHNAAIHVISPLLPQRWYDLRYSFHNGSTTYRYWFRIVTGKRASQVRVLSAANLQASQIISASGSQVNPAPWPIGACN